MPFTLSHPAAVLPLRRTGLPMAALVCGSMSPDLHMVVPGVSVAMTHRWLGVPTIDTALGMALTAVWVYALGPTARAAAPQWVRERLDPAPRYTARTWGLAVVGVLVGAVTHVGWDAFTHYGMWGWRHIPWLYESHHGHPGYFWTQYLSSVLGLVVIAVWAVWSLRHRAPCPVMRHPRAVSARVALAVPVVVAGVFASGVSALVHHRWAASTDIVVSSGMRVGLVLATVGSIAGALAWRVRTAHAGGTRI